MSDPDDFVAELHWEQVSGIFRSIASWWSDCTDQWVELLAAGVSGDLAYTVELEHTSVSKVIRNG